MNIAERLGLSIKEKRIEKKMSQIELGSILNVTNKSISKWENGKCLPEKNKLDKLFKVLGLNKKEFEELFNKHPFLFFYNNPVVITLLVIVINVLFYIIFCIPGCCHNDVNIATNNIMNGEPPEIPDNSVEAISTGIADGMIPSLGGNGTVSGFYLFTVLSSSHPFIKDALAILICITISFVLCGIAIETVSSLPVIIDAILHIFICISLFKLMLMNTWSTVVLGILLIGITILEITYVLLRVVVFKKNM